VNRRPPIRQSTLVLSLEGFDNPVMRLGYNTNGFAHHRLEDAFAILAEIGYRSVAVTLDRDLLDPPDRRGVADAVERLKPLVDRSGLTVTIETGSRFILDPRRKHQPTLISGAEEGRRRRIEFLKAAVDVARDIGAESVSLWSGEADDDAEEMERHARLTQGLRELLTCAGEKNVGLAFEPEPAMFIDTMAKFARLHAELSNPLFGLTLDVGHIHCLGDGSAADHIRQWRDVLWNVHIEDMRRGAHEHVMFGEGEMDFAPIFAALRDIDYAGPVHVELSRHSHDAVNAARMAFEYLRPFV
jgi:sugar phosphate isomerase/epimerase